MNILLQSKETFGYVGSVGHWTPSPAEALDFASSVEALCFCYDHGLFHMQIVLRADGREDIAFAVTDARLN